MLLTSPGKVSGTETIIAAAARQFCECECGQARMYSSFRRAYNSISISISSMGLIHRGNVDICAVYEPILSVPVVSLGEILSKTSTTTLYHCAAASEVTVVEEFQ
jgi:hypothetical protein